MKVSEILKELRKIESEIKMQSIISDEKMNYSYMAHDNVAGEFWEGKYNVYMDVYQPIHNLIELITDDYYEE